MTSRLLRTIGNEPEHELLQRRHWLLIGRLSTPVSVSAQTAIGWRTETM